MPLDFHPTFLTQFQRDGFVHGPHFLRLDEVEEFNRRMDHIIFEVVPHLAVDGHERVDVRALLVAQHLEALGDDHREEVEHDELPQHAPQRQQQEEEGEERSARERRARGLSP